MDIGSVLPVSFAIFGPGLDLDTGTTLLFYGLGFGMYCALCLEKRPTFWWI